MIIANSYFNLANNLSTNVKDAFLSGTRIDSCEFLLSETEPQVAQVDLPDIFGKFESLGLDANSRAILNAVDKVGLPNGKRIAVLVTVGNSHAAPQTIRYGRYDMLPGIISYVLGTSGPALLVGSTCDSFGSMITLAQSMMQRRLIDGAILAGANLILDSKEIKPSPILSPTRTCRPFSGSRDGSWPGLGFGAVSLSSQKPSSGDLIIEGAATSSAGKGRASFTAPSVSAQVENFELAWKMSGLRLTDASFIETHGTGTTIGDILEAEALNRVLERSARDQPLVLGASKSLVGHLDSCSGIASFAQVITCLDHGQYPNYPSGTGYEQDKALLRNNLKLGHGEPLPKGAPIVGITMNGISGSTTHIVLRKVS